MLPEGIQSPFLLVTWSSILVCVVVIYAYYSSALTTELSVVIPNLPFTTLFELYHDTQFRVVAVKETSNEEVFQVGEVMIAFLFESLFKHL